MAQATGPARRRSSRPQAVAGGPEPNNIIKKARRRPPAAEIRACKHACGASKIRHANRDPARRRRGGNTFPDRWPPRRAERLSPTGVYLPCRRNHPARAVHAKTPPPRQIHSLTLANNMARAFSAIFLLLGASLHADLVPIPDSPFSIECPPRWKVVSGRPEETRGEYYPGKGIESEAGHIHIYKRLSKTVSDAIDDTRQNYKKMESRDSHKMPVLLKTEPFVTDRGPFWTDCIFRIQNR